jgi:hypothetical protein
MNYARLQSATIQTIIIISKIESDLRYPLLPELAVVVWLSFQEQTMEEEAPTNSKADQAVSRKLTQAEKTLKQKGKDQKQSDFIEKCSIADVLVDATNPKSLKGSSDTTALQSIKGACPNLLGANALRQFMIKKNSRTIGGSRKARCAARSSKERKMKIWSKSCMLKT